MKHNDSLDAIQSEFPFAAERTPLAAGVTAVEQPSRVVAGCFVKAAGVPAYRRARGRIVSNRAGDLAGP